MEMEPVVYRSRLGENALRGWKQRGGVVGRDHDPQPVEARPVPFHETGGDDRRQGGRDLVWIARCVKDVHQKLPADVDSRKPGVLVAVDRGVGAVDPLQNLVRTTASEGGAYEGT